VNHEQGHMEAWTTIVFFGLAVAGALAAAAARGWGYGNKTAAAPTGAAFAARRRA
jgi:hypothetical protein